MPSFPRSLALATGLSLTSSALILLPAPAQAAGPGLVISEVYGGGSGSATAVLDTDFVELHNTSTDPVPLLGKSLQSRIPGGTGVATTVFTLPDVSLPAGGKYLVAGTTVASPVGAPLPTPDAISSLAFANNSGQVWLASTTDPIDPNVPAGDAGSTFGTQVLDFIGWGASATSFEGTDAGPGTGVLTSVRRTDGADTDENGPDLVAGNPPTPETCGCPFVPEDVTATIAEIQGANTGTSPHLNDTVTTEGVVTAIYPTGGINGFYLQTGGSPATSDASDAVFVLAGPGLINSEYPAIGDSVRVTGTVAESGGATQVTVADETAVAQLPSPLPAVTPLAAAWDTLDTPSDKEGHEGELVEPQGAFTVTGVSGLHGSAEVGLAQGVSPLPQPTDAAEEGAADAVAAANSLKAITLDDGATTNYAPNNPNPISQGTALPWLTGSVVRVGAGVTFNQPLVLEYRSNSWRLMPTERLIGDGSAVAEFTDTRTGDSEPMDVGGDVGLATFNVQNYFTTTGEEFVGAGGSNACTYLRDRESIPITVSSCTPDGPRGAASDASLMQQQRKLVAAINGLGASVVGLQEVENSAKFGAARDHAIDQLVAALNADAGSGTWAAVPSPEAADRPAEADEAVIRNALIYKPAELALVGGSVVMQDEANFDNAVEPLAQAFKGVTAPDTEAFSVVVNQFAERGAAGAAADRVDQAAALTSFADDFATERGTQAILLAGDFNAYTKETPLLDLIDAGYGLVASDTAGDATYSANGLSGSLDHVLGNAAALAMVTGADAWGINAPESVAYHYSRFHGNATDFVDSASPFASSDHNPVLVGFDLPDPPGPVVSGTTTTVSPGSIRAGSGRATIHVDVSAAAGTPTGTVGAYLGATKLAEATLVGGSATLRVGPFTTAGKRSVDIQYGGGTGFAASETDVVVTVVKAIPTMTVKRSPSKVVVKKTRAKLAVVVGATGLTPTGAVQAKIGSRLVARGNLRSGRLTMTLPKFKKTGTFAVTVIYAGSAHVGGLTKRITIRVRR